MTNGVNNAVFIDTNIVATMLVYGINQILTNNVADFNRFSQVITVLPLVENES